MVNGIYTIDAHCHIYPEKIVDKAVAGTDKFYGVKSYCRGTVADLLKVGADADIDHFLVQSVATTPKQVKSINEFIAGEVALYPDKLTGLGTLHPDSQDMAGDIGHIIELGLKGVKLHPDIQAFPIDDSRCIEMYEICEKKGLPILIHTGDNRYDYSNPNRLLPVLKAYEGLTVIGAHLGGYSIWQEACEAYCGINNFYVDCSSSMPWLKPQETLKIIRSYGADKVLFGTDYPMWNPTKEIDGILSLGLDENEIMSILNMNAKKVFNLK